VKARLAAIAGILVVAGAAAGASLYSTAVCGCLSPAQAVMGASWPHMDRAAMKTLSARVPYGRPVAEIHQALAASGYAKYCTNDRANGKTVCMLPYDRNFWRERAAQVTFAYDADGILRSMGAEGKTRYLWQ
jgi:hypothetical protein